MSKVWERRIIYTFYTSILLLLVLAVVSASAWELKREYKQRTTPECAKCLADFAGCNDMMDKAYGEMTDPVEPMRYVESKLSCVDQAVKCGQDNKCSTRIEYDKEK